MLADLKSADARGALLVAFMGPKAAARMLKVREGKVVAAEERAAAAAFAAEAAWEAHLLAECISDGVTHTRDASHVTMARARRRFAAAHAAPPAYDPCLLFTGASDVFTARCRKALDFVLLHFGRESPYQTVQVGDFHLPRIDLTAHDEEIWRVYETSVKERGDVGISRSSFLRLVILPQMKLRTRKTCCCSHCEDGADAIEALGKLLSTLATISGTTGNTTGGKASGGDDNSSGDGSDDQPSGEASLRLCVAALDRDLRRYGIDVAERLAADVPDMQNYDGKLLFEDLLALPIVSLDGLRDAIDAAAAGVEAEPDKLGDWLAEARTHAAMLERFKRHLLGRSWQNVRQRQKVDLLVAKFHAGIRAAVVIKDFKAKQALKTVLKERQSEYWDNGSVSIWGAVIISYDENGFQREYLDLVSADTVQDAVWEREGVAELGRHMVGRGFQEVDFHTDNAYHFHNCYVFEHIALEFVRALGLRAFSWQFCEPGEGKDECDGHFGACASPVSGAATRY